MGRSCSVVAQGDGVGSALGWMAQPSLVGGVSVGPNSVKASGRRRLSKVGMGFEENDVVVLSAESRVSDRAKWGFLYAPGVGPPGVINGWWSAR